MGMFLPLIKRERVSEGDSYFDESWNFNFYMVSSCSIWSPIFKTVFVFDVRPFLLLSVKFFGFKIAKNTQNDPFWAFWGVLKMALRVPESKF